MNKKIEGIDGKEDHMKYAFKWVLICGLFSTGWGRLGDASAKTQTNSIRLIVINKPLNRESRIVVATRGINFKYKFSQCSFSERPGDLYENPKDFDALGIDEVMKGTMNEVDLKDCTELRGGRYYTLSEVRNGLKAVTTDLPTILVTDYTDRFRFGKSTVDTAPEARALGYKYEVDIISALTVGELDRPFFINTQQKGAFDLFEYVLWRAELISKRHNTL